MRTSSKFNVDELALKIGRWVGKISGFFAGFNTRERQVGAVLTGLLFTALIVWGVNGYVKSTELVPTTGGVYREGMIGGPRYLNPVLAPLNEVDRDLSRLLYRGLMKLNTDGQLSPDLAQSITVSEDKKTYDIALKDGLFWQDGNPITAEDVIFTLHTIQDPAYKSPIKANWEGVNIEKVNDTAIKITLFSAYASFLENLTIGILPRHIWQDVSPEGFAHAEFNLRPIGSGPYQVDKIERTPEGGVLGLMLIINERYSGTRPFIPTLFFKFYDSDGSLLNAYEERVIDGMTFLSPIQAAKAASLEGLVVHKIPLPRYFAVFFNMGSDKLKSLKAREALVFALDRDAIIKETLDGAALPVSGPIPSAALFSSNDTPKRAYDLAKAQELMKSLGDQAPKEITLATLDDPQLKLVAERVKDFWSQLGIEVVLQPYEPRTLKEDIIRNRSYDALLFGQALRRNPDPFSFWHSLQTKDPGLNIAEYRNTQVDKLLTEARQTFDPATRAAKYAEFQALVVSDAPAAFLYSPLYLYGARENIKGIVTDNLSTPEDRFSHIANWFIKTRRIFPSSGAPTLPTK